VAKKAVGERLRLRENFDRFNFAIHKEKEMADFRRWILAFAALVLVLGSAVPASAQHGLVCTASASVTPTLRHEGFTELTGDILLNCTGAPGATSTPPGTPIPQADISVSLSAPVTSRILSGNATEALLLVDDPSPSNQDPCLYPDNPTVSCQVPGDGGQTFNNPIKFNVFQGINTGGPGSYSITFLGVPVDPPATTRTYRITNVRIDATSVPSGAAGLSPVFAFVSSSSSTSIQINNPQNYVGFVSNGLTTTTKVITSSFLQCLTYPMTQVGTVTFTEDFATAFKISGSGVCSSATPPVCTYSQRTPGIVYYTESGLEVAVYGGEAGNANSATELQLAISNIPSGVTIYADSYSVSSASTGVDTAGFSDATMVSPVLGSAISDLAPGTSGGPVAVNTTCTPSPCTSSSTVTTNPSATVVWTISDTNTSAIDSLPFNIYASFTGTPGNPGTPTPNQAVTSLAGFSPQLAAYSSSGPIPEFSSTVNVPTTPTTLFSVSLCQTVLLFPYVTDFVGFDTGIAISNTSLDGLPVGATHQPGGCMVTFYGDGAVAANFGTAGTVSSTADTALTGGIIQPGETWAFSMSTVDSTFGTSGFTGTTGYAIAVCNFQYAHGYSFVSDYGLRNFAAAYLALIIPDAPRAPQPFFCSANGGSCYSETGEQLVH